MVVFVICCVSNLLTPSASEKWTGAVSTATLILLIIILGLAARSVHQLNKDPPTPIIYPSVTTVYESLGLVGLEGKSWDDIKTEGYGTQVSINLFGPSGASAWFRDFLVPKVSQEYGIILNVNEITATADAVTTVSQQVASKQKGTIDLMWVNGANFKTMKTGNMLYGPWANKVPSASNFDWLSPDLAYDFGEPTKGLEMPFFEAQIVFVFNMAKVAMDTLPQSMTELVAAVTTPGHPLYQRFAYASPGKTNGATAVPGDFTGSAFARMFLYSFGGGFENFQGAYNEAKLDSVSKAVLVQLKALEDGLYRMPDTTVPYYCPAQADCDQLYQQEEIFMTMSYNPSIVGQKLNTGWPAESNSYVPSEGSIANVNFITIPINAPNIPGALLVGNYVGSLAAQFSRRSSQYQWIQSYSDRSPGYTQEESGGWQTAFEYLRDHVNYQTTPSTEMFRAPYSLPEPNANYASKFDTYWYNCLVSNIDNIGSTICPP